MKRNAKGGGSLTVDFSKMNDEQLRDWCAQSEAQQYAPMRGRLVLSKEGSMDGNDSPNEDDAMAHAETLDDSYQSPEAADDGRAVNVLSAVKGVVSESVFRLLCAMSETPICEDTGRPNWAEIGRKVGCTRASAYDLYKESLLPKLGKVRAAIVNAGFKPRQVKTDEQYVASQCRSITRQVRRQVRRDARAGLI